MKIESLMMFAGIALLFISWGWYVIIGFRDKFSTGLGNLLLVPIVPIIYTIMKPKETYKPFVLALLGIAIFFVPAL